MGHSPYILESVSIGIRGMKLAGCRDCQVSDLEKVDPRLPSVGEMKLWLSSGLTGNLHTVWQEFWLYTLGSKCLGLGPNFRHTTSVRHEVLYKTIYLISAFWPKNIREQSYRVLVGNILQGCKHWLARRCRATAVDMVQSCQRCQDPDDNTKATEIWDHHLAKSRGWDIRV